MVQIKLKKTTTENVAKASQTFYRFTNGGLTRCRNSKICHRRSGRRKYHFLVVLVNGFVGYWQERKAEESLDGLKQMMGQEAVVLIDGQNNRFF